MGRTATARSTTPRNPKRAPGGGMPEPSQFPVVAVWDTVLRAAEPGEPNTTVRTFRFADGTGNTWVTHRGGTRLAAPVPWFGDTTAFEAEPAAYTEPDAQGHLSVTRIL